MAELLLVSNPKKRRRKKKLYGAAAAAHAKKHRRKGKRRHKVKAAAPARRRRRSHHRPKNSRPAEGYIVGRGKIRRRKLNPRHRRRHHARSRRRHRNPSLRNITGQVMPTMKAGAWGAAGALGLDVLWGLMVGNMPSLAAYLTNPYVGFLAKAVAAVGVGSLGGHIAKGKGRELAVGAMTVVAHDFFKTTLQGLAPTIFGAGGSLPLGAYLSGYGDTGMGAYLSGAAPIVGTATIPQAYLPFSGSSGNSGTGDGVYNEDRMGLDTWS
jgi:hypothetical protein